MFVTAGMRPQDAAIVADNLVGSDCRGCFRMGRPGRAPDVKRLQTGSTDPIATPEVVETSGATAIVDGRNAMGQVVGEFAVEQAIEQAREHGVGVVGVRGSNHFGTCEYYAMKASAAHMIGIVATVSSQQYYGAIWRCRGADWEQPGRHRHPDALTRLRSFSISAMSVAAGQNSLSGRNGWFDPRRLGIGRDGKADHGPASRAGGDGTAIAANKGYGLAFMVAMLSAVDPGQHWARRHGPLPGLHPRTERRALCPGDRRRPLWGCGGIRRTCRRCDELMHSAKRPAGADHILVPGEREHLTALEQRAHGIAYPRAIVDDFNRALGAVGTTTWVDGQKHEGLRTYIFTNKYRVLLLPVDLI